MSAELSVASAPARASMLWPWQTHTRLAWYKHLLRTERDGHVLLAATGEAIRWDPNEAELWHNALLLLALAGESGPAEAAYFRLLRLNPVLRAQAEAAAAKANSTGGKESTQ